MPGALNHRFPHPPAKAKAVPACSARTSDHAPSSWKRKMAVRVAAGLGMAALVAAVVRAGHLAVCAMLIAIQCAIFGELVALRFTAARRTATEGPMFRTVQWGWFATAMLHSYSSSWLKAPLGGHLLLARLRGDGAGDGDGDGDGAGAGASPEAIVEGAAVGLYSAMLVVTVLSLTPGLYAQQIGQLSWTGLVLMAVVFQLKVMVYSIYSGLYFFVFPASLVIANDTFAYFCGMACGRKLVDRPFLALSPNKTFEGFGGALLLTVLYAYGAADAWGRSPWMRCAFPELAGGGGGGGFGGAAASAADAAASAADAAAAPGGMQCASDQYFGLGSPGAGGAGGMSRAQMAGVALALFASLIAPFGGFFASAVKRASSVKDFAAVIPGHGGFTDRMDCQLIMGVAAWAVYAVSMPGAVSLVGNFRAAVA